MKKALIVHNPTAGDNAAEKDELIKLVEIADFKAHYVSTADEGWKNFSLVNADVLVVAGGDGTVRRLAKTLLKNHNTELHVPIAVVPLGTANNIANTLSSGWGAAATIDLEQYGNFDTARVEGFNKHSVMLESLGFGAFPRLMHEMKAEAKENESAKEKIKRSQSKLVQILKDFKPFSAIIDADGERISDEFLMIELMNVKSVGPSLNLAPEANVGDGNFDLVLIRKEDRENIILYVQALYDSNDVAQSFIENLETRRIKHLRIVATGIMAHVDDELIRNPSSEAYQVEMEEGTFKFLDFSKEVV